jgi:hypothetical protein
MPPAMLTRPFTCGVLALLAGLILLVTGCSSGSTGQSPPEASSLASSGPATPDASASEPSSVSRPGASTEAVGGLGRCSHVPDGPATPPSGAVRVDSAVVGDLSAKTEANPPGTVSGWLLARIGSSGTNMGRSHRRAVTATSAHPVRSWTVRA